MPNEYSKHWQEINSFLNVHFEKPDINVLRVALAQYAVHFCLSDPPVWSFILGPSSSGKTRIVLDAVGYLPYTYKVDSLTPNTFISGYGRDFGILNQLPDNQGIILFSDFSSFLGLRQELRAEVQGQLRRIFDGELDKPVGNKKLKDMPKWEGKVTIIAACTNAIERYWSVESALGERFVQVRMKARGVDDIDRFTAKSLAMLGKEKQIDNAYRDLILQFVDVDNLREAHISPGWEQLGLFELNRLVALSRTSVSRDKQDRITDISEWEFPGRLAKELACIAKGNAMLMRRSETTEKDIRLALTVGLNTIPRRRWQILRILSLIKAESVQQQDVMKFCPDMTRHVFERTRDELVAIGMIEMSDQGYVYLSLTKETRDLLNAVNYKIRKNADIT